MGFCCDNPCVVQQDVLVPNQLPIGESRFGDFVDFDPGTPDVKAALQRSEAGISLTLAWSEPSSPYAQWFIRDDIAEMVKESGAGEPQPPSRVLFHDSHGSVLLLGCRARGYHSNMFGPGSGTVHAYAAVLGVENDCDFESPHGLRSQVSGLREWLGVSSWKVDFHGTDPALPDVTVTPLDRESIEIGNIDGLSLSLDPGWRLDPNEGVDKMVLHDLLRCTTRSQPGAPWSAHVQVHRAIRDLLVLSRWCAESLVEVAALRNDDPLVTLDDVEHGPQWRQVVVKAVVPEPSETRHRQHLIRFDDLGADGVRRWIRLRDEYRRALDPVISGIELKDATAHTMLAHTAPGLEALGYLLMLRDGVKPARAAGSTLGGRFERILADVGDCLPFDGPEWGRTTSTVYNALKHANRAAPEPVDVANAWRKCVMVVRAWVALELGVPRGTVKDRLAGDPQASKFVRVG
jgi:hypothetical protein